MTRTHSNIKITKKFAKIKVKAEDIKIIDNSKYQRNLLQYINNSKITLQ